MGVLSYMLKVVSKSLVKTGFLLDNLMLITFYKAGKIGYHGGFPVAI
jgi:hypothetical protein